MELLRILTLIYAAVLVVVLATVLIVILYYLRRIGSTLGRVAESLMQVRDRSAPLSGLLEPVEEEARGIGDEMERSAELIRAVERRLESIAEEERRTAPGGRA